MHKGSEHFREMMLKSLFNRTLTPDQKSELTKLFGSYVEQNWFEIVNSIKQFNESVGSDLPINRLTD